MAIFSCAIWKTTAPNKNFILLLHYDFVIMPTAFALAFDSLL